MNSRKWSLTKAAIYGAALGIPLLLVRDVLLAENNFSGDTAYIVGVLIGSVIGGVILFVVVAAIRNLFVR